MPPEAGEEQEAEPRSAAQATLGALTAAQGASARQEPAMSGELAAPSTPEVPAKPEEPTGLVLPEALATWAAQGVQKVQQALATWAAQAALQAPATQEAQALPEPWAPREWRVLPVQRDLPALPEPPSEASPLGPGPRRVPALQQEPDPA